jgi:hypothetical protein
MVNGTPGGTEGPDLPASLYSQVGELTIREVYRLERGAGEGAYQSVEQELGYLVGSMLMDVVKAQVVDGGFSSDLEALKAGLGLPKDYATITIYGTSPGRPWTWNGMAIGPIEQRRRGATAGQLLVGLAQSRVSDGRQQLGVQGAHHAGPFGQFRHRGHSGEPGQPGVRRAHHRASTSPGVEADATPAQPRPWGHSVGSR